MKQNNQMRSIVHVGPHKTGSTYIQKCLNDSREYLLSQGYFYPVGNPGHHELVTEFQNTHSCSKINALAEEVSRSPSTRGFILSAEKLINLNPRMLRRMISSISTTALVSIVYAYRPSLDLAQSFFTSDLRSGSLESDPSDVGSWMNILLRNDVSATFLRTIDRIGRSTGCKLFFYEVSSTDQDIPVRAFCSLLNIDSDGLTIPKSRVNRSPSEFALSYLISLNRLAPKVDITAAQRSNIVNEVEKAVFRSIKASSTSSSMASKVIEELLDAGRLQFSPPKAAIEICKEFDLARRQVLSTWMELPLISNKE